MHSKKLVVDGFQGFSNPITSCVLPLTHGVSSSQNPDLLSSSASFSQIPCEAREISPLNLWFRPVVSLAIIAKPRGSILTGLEVRV